MSGPIVGIDPGLTGAIAYYYPDQPNLIAVEDMPVAGSEVDPATLAQRLRVMAPFIAFIEYVASRPGAGVSSMFRFGCGYGMVQGVIASLGIPVRFVTPGKWKKHYRITADKEEARALALQCWPTSDRFSRKKDAGRAEAALIARYGAAIMAAPLLERAA